jgi:hypothetical protein
MNVIDINNDDVLLDNNLDWGGEPIFVANKKLDNEYAQMVQDLLEMRS